MTHRMRVKKMVGLHQCYAMSTSVAAIVQTVDKAVDFADHMRDVAKEDAVDMDSFGDKIR